MKLSSTMRRALRNIIIASVGKGRRGLLYANLRSSGISLRTVDALVSRGLVSSRFTRYGTGYREVLKATPKGRKAYTA